VLARDGSRSLPLPFSGAPGVAPAWPGSFDLYREGVFATQQTRNWCTAACIQMMLNITLDQRDQSKSNQQRYIRYERRHDLYTPRQAKGSDPRGWAAAMRHFGGGTSYDDVARATFDDAIRKAVGRLRQTGKPVGLLVDRGTHAWVMTGFCASGDPAAGGDFTVTHVMVMGPLYPEQKRGYDMAPGTKLTAERLEEFFGPYADHVLPDNPWQGLYVTIEP
jgi:hypothetical protein